MQIVQHCANPLAIININYRGILTKTPFKIEPKHLNADAVAPACIDNQYLSRDLLTEICRKGTNYQDSLILSKRALTIKTEFIRSLVYSSQMVINRAYFVNNPNLYRLYTKSSPDAHAFAKLMTENAIVAFAMKETRILEDFDFGVDQKGVEAARNLLELTESQYGLLRFSWEAEKNQRQLVRFKAAFARKLSAFEHAPELLEP